MSGSVFTDRMGSGTTLPTFGALEPPAGFSARVLSDLAGLDASVSSLIAEATAAARDGYNYHAAKLLVDAIFLSGKGCVNAVRVLAPVLGITVEDLGPEKPRRRSPRRRKVVSGE